MCSFQQCLLSDIVLHNSWFVEGPLLRTLPDDARPIHSLLLVERRFVRSQTDAMLSSAQRTLRAVGVARAMLDALWAGTAQ